jgi:hypothetical protein
MRLSLRLPTLLAALALAALTGVAAAGALGHGDDVFTLEPRDTLLFEASGCQTECALQGERRVCKVRGPTCRAVCRPVPGCQPEGAARPLQACVVVRDGP